MSLSSDDVVEKIKDKFLEGGVRCLSDYVSDKLRYLVYEFMIISYNHKKNTVDISFDVSTRADLSASFTLVLSKTHKFKNINVLEVYSSESDGKILIGENCVRKHQEKLKDKIISDFLVDQYHTHFLKNNQIGEMC